ncbi:hypothetical protein SAMN05443248_7853 [Bradyrhizobium erythrophlei]|uniref:Uncharacterized protein n=1 Tax=Bradyrhizobium erythrophlei TaxID=1437360 RepID=A0A1M5Y2C6_9BRAD|nr:hypothetical protein SAMN05443248_7853 [Bradyrhizobium erythrophlei]
MDKEKSQGYDLTPTGDGERIVATAITERFCKRADGQLESLTSGSARAVAQVVTHAGICKVKRYGFSISLNAGPRSLSMSDPAHRARIMCLPVPAQQLGIL